MAKEVQIKKRTASVPEGETVKVKKVKKVEKATTEVIAEPARKRKATEDAAPVTVKKPKTPKPALKDATEVKPPQNPFPAEKAAKGLKPAKAVKTKATKVAKLAKPTSDGEDVNQEYAEDLDDESEIDDQTEALLKGFEGGESDSENEGGLKDGDEVPDAPISNRSRKLLQKLVDFPKSDKPGVVYVGHIPHGFYEHEMREYFKQFGTILKLRMSRNRRTGASKHIAWIEFESAAVAEIVAKTMDNYLLFSHILKVKVVSEAQVPASLFKGANRRFKKVPWNKIEGRKLSLAKPEAAWDRQSGREQARRELKADKLKAIGYEFEAPKIKSAKGLGKKPEQPALIADKDVEINAGEEVPVIEQEITTTTILPASKNKEKKQKGAKAVEAVVEQDLVVATQTSSEPKKGKKSMIIEAAVEDEAEPVVEASSKLKKEKKRKVIEVESTTLATIVTPAEPTEKVTKVTQVKKLKTALVDDAGEVTKGKSKKQKTKAKATE